MSKKVISIGLNSKDINRAIKEIEQYKVELRKKLEECRKRIAEAIASTAQSNFNSAGINDLPQGGIQRTADVTVRVDEQGTMTVIVADGEDAVWCEFGAGVYHNGAPGSSPHPKGSELGFTIGGYGIGMGKRQTWGFYEDGELHLTHGTPALMPMYNSLKTVCEEITKIAREIWK